MDLMKLKFYIEVLTIAFNFVAIPYALIMQIAGIVQITPTFMAVQSLCIVVMLTMNQTWKDLLRKWKGGGKR